MNDRRGNALFLRPLLETLILALACLAPWAFGSVDAWAEFGLELGIVVITILRLIFGEKTGWKQRLFCLPSLAMAGLVALALLQATSLPAGLRKAVAGSSDSQMTELVTQGTERVVGDLGTPIVSSSTLSQEPNASFDTAARLAALWLLFQAVLGLEVGPQSLRRFGLAMALNATLLSLFALVQALTWNGKIFWIRPSPTSGGWNTGGPFVSHNNLAEYLNIGLGFALAFLMSARRDPNRSRVKGMKVWAAYAVGVLVVGIITSNSRGGFLAMLVSTLVTAGLLIRFRWGRNVATASRRSSQTFMRSRWFAVGAAVIASIGLVALFLVALGDASPYQTRLSTILNSGDEGYSLRMDIWRDSLRAWKDNPFWGTGLGTFASAAAPYFLRDRGWFWGHAENEYVQILVEGGVIGLGLALTLIGSIAWLGRRALASSTESDGQTLILGAVFGGLALSLQSLSDFGLHIAGIAVPAVILVGHLCRMGLEARERSMPNVSTPVSTARIGFILASLVMTGMAISVAARGLGQARAEALLMEARVPLPGSSVPVPDREALPIERLEQMRDALIGALRIRPQWAEGYNRLGLIELSLYELSAGEWIASALGKDELAKLPSSIARLSDPLWLLTPAQTQILDEGERIRRAEAVVKHEPVRDHLVPAARCFLEARRCCPVSALAQTELAALDFLLVGGDSGPISPRRALRLASDRPMLRLLSRIAIRLGDLDLVAQCLRKSLEVHAASWKDVADTAKAVLPAETILEQVLPKGARYPILFADQLYSAPEDRAIREQFLKAALARLPEETVLEPIDRLWLEARARARLEERDRARQQMEEAIMAEPMRSEWREEFVRWLIEWNLPEVAHQQALAGTQLAPDHVGLRQSLQRAIEARARGQVPTQLTP